jgi:hypothetical protein
MSEHQDTTSPTYYLIYDLYRQVDDVTLSKLYYRAVLSMPYSLNYGAV